MKTLILVTRSDGHHLEYVEHLLKMTQLSADSFIFCLHPKFREFSTIHDFIKDNVVIDYMSDKEVSLPANRIKHSLKSCLLLKKKIKKYKVNKVFLIMLMPYGPFIFIPNLFKVDISGIIYTIYLYKWKEASLLKKIYDASRFWLMSKCGHIKSVFVLNDNGATIKLNNLYRTNKFKFLVDPFQPIEGKSACYDIRNKYKNKIVISHIGGLKVRKGTYSILSAIEHLKQETRNKYVFIFGGKAENQVLFDDIISRLKVNTNIEYYKGFITFENIAEIVSSSDLLLLPYHNTNQSSGIIGYGAQFGVPVAVPNKDLLAKLVRRNRLGYLLKGCHSDDIEFFLDNFPNDYSQGGCYLKNNTVQNFNQIIKENI